MILSHSSRQFSTVRFNLPTSSSPALLPTRIITFTPASLPRRLSHFNCTSALPFPAETAKHHRELQAAIDVVETAYKLCLEVQTALQSSSGGVPGKSDDTPVTVADFSVQALISLELGRRFPSIPLVAEEDSASVRANNLVEPVVKAVVDKASAGDEPLTAEHVLEAIDRGGPEAFTFGAEPATYWLLDPIDGTRGFVMGNKALFVVGLALVVDGEIVLGVMGCPCWQDSNKCISGVQEEKSIPSETGLLMVSHIGCGTWTRSLSAVLNGTPKTPYSWTRCFVDSCSIVPQARFCITESEPWEALPPAALYTSTADADSVGDGRVLVLKPCCGSLCKYLLVASGRGSVFIQRRKEKVIKAWDHAVGIICVLEAGGTATDWEGNQVDLAADEGGRRNIYPQGGFLVSNGKIHNQLLELISSTLTTVSG
ncbi:putative PAP-specific phosphatase, mitochondrial [Argentina anserina]|uniref:putative PAP-specific phosphatase, mitochondrial n=1 Tax=Argentina anserina TaxID=57926 RepID=UPI0021763F08|nr:putative PAP-specific phosphatase, mitochondrial [Potentilla anserina]